MTAGLVIGAVIAIIAAVLVALPFIREPAPVDASREAAQGERSIARLREESIWVHLARLKRIRFSNGKLSASFSELP